MSHTIHRVGHSPLTHVRRYYSVLLPCFVIAMVMYSAVGTMSQVITRPNPTVTSADRLFIAVFQLGEALDTLYQAEDKRLRAACKSSDSGCLTRFSPVRRVVAALHSSDSSASPVVGSVHAVLKVSGEESGGLAIGLDIEWAGKPGQYESWMSNVRDWGNGIRVEGVGSRRRWVQLSGRPFTTPVWMSTEGELFSADVITLEGEILRLQPLNARRPDKTLGPTTAGNYLILAVKGSQVEFREEVASDFACGKPVATPAVLPPTLRATADEFFNKDGSPRFSVVYTKGC